jgi:hypothetical protein
MRIEFLVRHRARTFNRPDDSSRGVTRWLTGNFARQED